MNFDMNDHKEFLADLVENGFHIFSRQNAKVEGFYPNAFPPYPEFDITELKEGDTITIRAFFPTSQAKLPSIDSGRIDLDVEHIDRNEGMLFANIITELPDSFALSRGTTIEIDIGEVLSVRDR